jgi:predicted dehydrogenase
VPVNALEQAAQDHPRAFTCSDYQEAFEKDGNTFDAAIVATPAVS